MTERLKQLLHDEAGDLSVPPPATDDVLREGRGLRRRTRLATGAAGLAAAVVVGGTVVALSGGGGNQSAPDPATTPLSGNPVFSYGNQVFYDGPEHVAEIQDTAVKSLYYTSAGVLVRHGENSNSDGGGPQRFSLVTPDGTVKRLSLETEDTVHASDLDQSYVVYGEAVDGELQVVVYDVTADAEEARITVGPTDENWFPVALDGDTVWVGDGSTEKVFEVDWKAETSAPSDVPSTWLLTDGRLPTVKDGHPVVMDAATGEVLITADAGQFDLSPDGRYALLRPDDEMMMEPETQQALEVYDVETGGSVTVTGDPYAWGWTADGDLFQVEKAQVRTCDSGTGECTTAPYAEPSIPQPEPVTHTVKEPMCSGGGLECHTDPEFYEKCAEDPDSCEWLESTYVEEPTVELRLGGRVYES